MLSISDKTRFKSSYYNITLFDTPMPVCICAADGAPFRYVGPYILSAMYKKLPLHFGAVVYISRSSTGFLKRRLAHRRSPLGSSLKTGDSRISQAYIWPPLTVWCKIEWNKRAGISVWISVTKSYHYLHYLHSDNCPHFCCFYHNVSAFPKFISVWITWREFWTEPFI